MLTGEKILSIDGPKLGCKSKQGLEKGKKRQLDSFYVFQVPLHPEIRARQQERTADGTVNNEILETQRSHFNVGCMLLIRTTNSRPPHPRRLEICNL